MSLKERIAHVRELLDNGTFPVSDEPVEDDSVVILPPSLENRPPLVIEPQTVPVVSPVTQMVQKSGTGMIRKTVLAWFRTMTPAQVHAITPDQFKTKVLSIDPNWPIADKGEKVIKSHLSWYRTNFKKTTAETRV